MEGLCAILVESPVGCPGGELCLHWETVPATKGENVQVLLHGGASNGGLSTDAEGGNVIVLLGKRGTVGRAEEAVDAKDLVPRVCCQKDAEAGEQVAWALVLMIGEQTSGMFNVLHGAVHLGNGGG